MILRETYKRIMILSLITIVILLLLEYYVMPGVLLLLAAFVTGCAFGVALFGSVSHKVEGALWKQKRK